jgi:inorganic pyrophosphatase
LLQKHPWHGVSPGDSPESIFAFVEIVPTDTVKYELDKESGHLKIDRPQRFSSMCPSLYGFIPQTYCGEQIGQLCMSHTLKAGIIGDGDPLDICILTERPIAHGNIFVTAKPIGGLLMIDHNEADDKIIAVLEGDLVFGEMQDINDCPQGLIDRLRHYFLSYKQLPNEPDRQVEITEVYDRKRALSVIETSKRDYQVKYGHLSAV